MTLMLAAKQESLQGNYVYTLATEGLLLDGELIQARFEWGD